MKKLAATNNNDMRLTGSPLAVKMMDVGFMCHIAEHLQDMAEGYSTRGDTDICQKIGEAILKITAASNHIAERINR